MAGDSHRGFESHALRVVIAMVCFHTRLRGWLLDLVANEITCPSAEDALDVVPMPN